jgi:ABC-type branched-subunit amino acid transport system substrate-binding protein
MGSGGWAADPSFRQVGADFLEGMIAFSPIFPHKLTPPEWIKRSLDQCRKEYSNEPFAGQELTYGWVLVPTVAEVLERAGSRDRKAIQEAARKLDVHDVMATRATAKQGMAFDETGRLAKKYQEVLIVQWQGGVAQTVFPSQLAVAKAAWPGTK